MRHSRLAVLALALLGCGDEELSGLSWWAGAQRSGSLRDFRVVSCTVDSEFDRTVSVTLGVDDPVIAYINLVFPQHTPHERLLGHDTNSYVFFTDAEGGAAPSIQTRWSIELGSIVPLELSDGTAFRDERAVIVHHLIIEDAELTHPATGRTRQVGGSLKDLRMICDDFEASVATGGRSS